MNEAASNSPSGHRRQERAHKRKTCIDCRRRAEAEGTKVPRRAAPYPGPRCSTCNRLKKAERKGISRAQRWERVYGITEEEYNLIWEEQGGKCALCRRATGAGRKKLSVDHCHKTGVVRGLLCAHDNAAVLGHARDEIEFFERCIDYLNNNPAVRAIGVRVVPDFEVEEDDEYWEGPED